jgi:hypothetical protein
MAPYAGAAGACHGSLAAAVPRPNRWQLASLAGREANVDNGHLYRVPVIQLTTYLFRMLWTRF